MPSHSHEGAVGYPITWVTTGDRININVSGQGGYPLDTTPNLTGGGQSHENRQPSKTVYIYKRSV